MVLRMWNNRNSLPLVEIQNSTVTLEDSSAVSYKTKCVLAKSLQSHPTLHDPRYYSLPGSSVHAIPQAKVLEWAAMPFSKTKHQFSSVAATAHKRGRETRATSRPRSGAEAGRTPCPRGSGQEELPHVQGQGQRLGAATPTSEVRGGGREELPRVQGQGRRLRQGCILLPCLFNLYAEYIMRSAGLEEAQAGIKIAWRNINNLRYADDTTLMAESEYKPTIGFLGIYPKELETYPHQNLYAYVHNSFIYNCQKFGSSQDIFQ